MTKDGWKRDVGDFCNDVPILKDSPRLFVYVGRCEICENDM